MISNLIKFVKRKVIVPLRGNAWDGLRTLPPGYVLDNGDSDDSRYVTISQSHSTFMPDRVGGGRALYSTRIQTLVEWAAAYNYTLTISHSVRPVVEMGYRLTLAERLPDQFIVKLPQETVPAPPHTHYTDSTTLTAPSFNDPVATSTFSIPPSYFTYNAFNPYTVDCELCEEWHPYGTVICPRTLELIVCPSCSERGVKVLPTYGSTTWPPNMMPTQPFTCSNCGTTCATINCENHVMRGYEYCETHAEHASCLNCGRFLEWMDHEDAPLSAGSSYVCDECERYICASCNRVSDYMTYSEMHDGDICSACRSDNLRRESEIYDTSADQDFTTMLTIPGRENIRLCGIEIEGGNGNSTGSALAVDFYRASMSSADHVTAHQSGDRYGFAHVEADSTVDWEAVIGPINMADSRHVGWLNSAVKLIRARVHTGDLKLDLRCGLHIHVSAEHVGLAQAYTLSHLFTYIEDPFFRLAAAKWPFHRASQGSNHCAPVPKHSRKLSFYQNHGGAGRGRDNHYYALSFMNYFNSMIRNCHCGAVGAGIWDECTCDLGKCTFEFRLFNTTANPKKILAYIALCQALVAKSIELPELKNPTQDYPLLEFNRQVFKEMGRSEAEYLIEAWKPRIRYILTELPLTEEEKDAVLYCIRNSELAALGESEIERLSMPEEVAV